MYPFYACSLRATLDLAAVDILRAIRDCRIATGPHSQDRDKESLGWAWTFEEIEAVAAQVDRQRRRIPGEQSGAVSLSSSGSSNREWASLKLLLGDMHKEIEEALAVRIGLANALLNWQRERDPSREEIDQIVSKLPRSLPVPDLKLSLEERAKLNDEDFLQWLELHEIAGTLMLELADLRARTPFHPEGRTDRSSVPIAADCDLPFSVPSEAAKAVARLKTDVTALIEAIKKNSALVESDPLWYKKAPNRLSSLPDLPQDTDDIAKDLLLEELYAASFLYVFFSSVFSVWRSLSTTVSASYSVISLASALHVL
eukprot:Cvel_24024.t1-p1 / transcript=Cvel_24024.t1 / gene=Cvel_24024 / organism=Chromera_velia_CCMP2878 / gene_product=hypothetical protein / transcript_product=hypothetical protein / location=Cvel_scaffold2549:23553-26933(-) / protein_length=313 / sequence_SO=supercontig / SO=protein_coding / is_pseudo=false